MLYLKCLVLYARHREVRRYFRLHAKRIWQESRTLPVEVMQSDIARMRREWAARKDAA